MFLISLGDMAGQSVLAPTKFMLELDSFKKRLTDAGLYKPDACAEHRQQHPQALRASKGSGIQSSLFADQSAQVQGWMNSILGGSKTLKSKLGEKEWDNFKMDNHLAAKVYTSGADWQCTSFSDFMFSKTIVLLDGDSQFIAGIPFHYYFAAVSKGGKNVVEVSNSFNMMIRSSLEKNGGFYVYLKQGEAITIPPGYLIFQCNHGAMDFGEQEVSMQGSDVMVPRLHFLLFLEYP